jgi:hypothetical protein
LVLKISDLLVDLLERHQVKRLLLALNMQLKIKLLISSLVALADKE